MDAKKCTKCSEEKPLSEFHKGAGRLGVRPDCKVCVRKRMADNHASNPEPARERQYNSCKCGNRKSRYSERCRGCAQPAFDIDNPSWRINKNGYVVAKSPTGEIRQHRWAMERHLGRSLLPHETVHHKNGIRDDNRIENLELWSVSQPAGQRVEDKLEWCQWFLEQYSGE